MNNAHNAHHFLSLDSRSSLKITAVDEVISFDDTLVSLALGDTTLNVSGEDLTLKNLSLENGEVEVTGTVSALTYFDGTPRRRRFGLFGGV